MPETYDEHNNPTKEFKSVEEEQKFYLEASNDEYKAFLRSLGRNEVYVTQALIQRNAYLKGLEHEANVTSDVTEPTDVQVMQEWFDENNAIIQEKLDEADQNLLKTLECVNRSEKSFEQMTQVAERYSSLASQAISHNNMANDVTHRCIKLLDKQEQREKDTATTIQTMKQHIQNLYFFCAILLVWYVLLAASKY